MMLDRLLRPWRQRLAGKGRRIVILLHEGTPERRLRHYSIARFIPTWIEDGHRVILARGADRVVPGDLLIVHVDLSVVPERYLDLASHYRWALNARIRDIRKSAISRNLVGPDSDWSGPVIVKSDLNCAGAPERKLLGDRKSAGHVLLPGEPALHFGALDRYVIYDHLDLVPEQHFLDPGLVVEKFRPEIHAGLYHVRTYHVLGTSANAYLHGSPDPLVKMSNIVTRQAVEAHPDIVALGREIGLDYGKIDYVVDHGEAVVLDVNKTTGGGGMAETPELLAARARRARALYDYWNDVP